MTLPPPHPALRACVVVPARNEEALIPACLEALAFQQHIVPEEYEVLLVLDRCEDATETRAHEFAAAHPSLRLHFFNGPGLGAGHARRVGMEAACQRLHDLGRSEGLIASTDADTVVSPDWLSAQLEAVSRGARAIGGRIHLAHDDSLPESVREWHAEYGRTRYERLLAEPNFRGRVEHWQFSGASLALTAAVYREVGGLEPLPSLEDEHLERLLRRRDIPIDYLLSVKVTTSPRLVGRAERGLSHDLALAAGRLASRSTGPSAPY
ncbi:MAG TPA: glycosyltransferase family A protein [Rubrobacteraceae bacterium]|nr:glycosyltransferase family A protein [Rubrobacteraceae bacterium]